LKIYFEDGRIFLKIKKSVRMTKSANFNFLKLSNNSFSFCYI
jgi:hypothetical protein